MVGEGQNFNQTSVHAYYQMQEEMQKTNENIGYRPKGKTESETYGGAQTYMVIVDDNLVEVQCGKVDLLERTLSPDNLQKAYKQVVGNKGVEDVDKMGTSELLPYQNLHLDELVETIKSGKYKLTAARRVEIPKDNGKNLTHFHVFPAMVVYCMLV